ncbi:MAG TPA: hypothetical protein QGF02_00605 [Candidatus Babeliales bacterium]|nr:hypothetical protein [Candidatus Babeliales bacterium]
MKKLSLILSLSLLTSGLAAREVIVPINELPLEKRLEIENSSSHHCNAGAKIILEGVNDKGKKESRAGYTYIRNLKTGHPQGFTVESAVKEKQDLSQPEALPSTPLAQGLSDPRVVDIKMFVVRASQDSKVIRFLENNSFVKKGARFLSTSLFVLGLKRETDFYYRVVVQ